MEPFAAAIREARRRAGLSQQEAGKRTGVSDKMISAYETGRNSPNVEWLWRALDAYDLRLADLEGLMAVFGGEESPLKQVEQRLERRLERLEKLVSVLGAVVPEIEEREDEP